MSKPIRKVTTREVAEQAGVPAMTNPSKSLDNPLPSIKTLGIAGGGVKGTSKNLYFLSIGLVQSLEPRIVTSKLPEVTILGHVPSLRPMLRKYRFLEAPSSKYPDSKMTSPADSPSMEIAVGLYYKQGNFSTEVGVKGYVGQRQGMTGRWIVGYDF